MPTALLTQGSPIITRNEKGKIKVDWKEFHKLEGEYSRESSGGGLRDCHPAVLMYCGAVEKLLEEGILSQKIVGNYGLIAFTDCALLPWDPLPWNQKNEKHCYFYFRREEDIREYAKFAVDSQWRDNPHRGNQPSALIVHYLNVEK